MTESASSVMVVDDDPGVRTALRANFVRYGWRVETAASVREAVKYLQQEAYDLIIIDIRLPDGSGMEVMRSARQADMPPAVILLTAYGSVPDAVRAMRDGALDYLTKPVSFEQLQARAEQVIRRANGVSAVAESCTAGDIVGSSPVLMYAMQRARVAATTDADVLIEAESGTGKELLARFVHDASTRPHKPFIAVNCAAVPESLLESELFGHGKGAFTGAVSGRPGKFELANGGTILLDEIGEMPLHLQPKLLRVLQEREVFRLGETKPVRLDIRVIATTNASLSVMVDQNQFRGDLYYRLNVIPLSLPPLRERLDDVPILAEYFAVRHAHQHNLPPYRLHAEFLARLQAYSWPGNVRELANFMRRVLALNSGPEINQSCFDREMRIPARQQETSHESPAGRPIRDVEREHLKKTLELTRGNRTHAAEMLGISLRTLRNKIREYELPPRRYA